MTKKQLKTLTVDMQTALDNKYKYLEQRTESGDRNADYHNAYLLGMIRAINIMGYHVNADADMRISIFRNEE